MREIVIVAGPTASGKSALALGARRRIRAARSSMPTVMQVYRDLAVLTRAAGRRRDGARAASSLRRDRRRGELLGRALAVRSRSRRSMPRAPRGACRSWSGGTGLYLDALHPRARRGCRRSRPTRARKRSALHAELGGAAFRARLAARDPVAARQARARATRSACRAPRKSCCATGAALGRGRPSRRRTADLRGGRRHRPAAAARGALRRLRRARFCAMIGAGRRGRGPRPAGARALRADLPAMKAVGVRELGAALARAGQPRRGRCCDAASDPALCQAAIHLVPAPLAWTGKYCARLTIRRAIFGKFTYQKFLHLFVSRC